MVVHHDEPTVPDWNINLLDCLMQAKSKRLLRFTLHFVRAALFPLTDESNMEAKDERKHQMAGCVTSNPVSFPVSAACSLPMGKQVALPSNTVCALF